MKPFLIRWAILTVAVFIAAQLKFLGIRYDSFGSLVAAALVLGVINTFVKPVLMVITMPFIFLSFGILILIINAALFSFAGVLVTGFHVDSFGSAIGGALVVSLISFLLGTDRRTVIVHREAEFHRPPPPPGKGPVIDV